MRHTLTLTILQPCAESWAAMTPTTTGRHCVACAKTVVDFTTMSDAEILAYLARAGSGAVCGRFADAQLARPLQPLVLAPAARWRTWLAAAVAVWGLREVGGIKAKAQAPAGQPEQSINSPRNYAAKPDYEGALPWDTIRGRVVDAATGRALPGVLVAQEGAPAAVLTGEDGRFGLLLPVTGTEVVLHFRCLRYQAARQVVAPGQPMTGLTVALQLVVPQPLSGRMGGVSVSRTITPPVSWLPGASLFECLR